MTVYCKVLSAVLILVLTLGVFGVSCHADENNQAENANNPALRDELLMRIERDQEARFAVIAWEKEHGVDGIFNEATLNEKNRKAHAALGSQVAEIDSNNTAWLKEIITESGWPTYSEVGVDGGDAAWLLVQHADTDAQFQRQCLDLMTELPTEEISQQNLAYLTDRVLLAEGQNQVYGTQFSRRDGKWAPLKLDDPENVDTRRAEVGLPPLAEYAEILENFYRGELSE